MMNPWIENVSMDDIERGHHYDAGPRGVLIQIVDPDMEFPTPKEHFSEIFQFKFLDIEEDHPGFDEMSKFAISDYDAERIATILDFAFEFKQNVVVHCVAGICRSGAVAEVGEALGFQPTEKYRVPNTLVKKKLMKALKLDNGYEENV